jgi:hypothetical protein
MPMLITAMSPEVASAGTGMIMSSTWVGRASPIPSIAGTECP